MRCILIDPEMGWWKEIEIEGEEDVKRLLGAKELERPALKLGDEYYGCWCDADAREKTSRRDTVVMRVKKRFKRGWRFFGCIAGPVVIHLNKGLEDVDIAFISRRILTYNDEEKSPFLLVEDYRNMMYEDTDP